MSGQITEFTLENVRCFEGEQTLRIRPITLLIGENSTGKSTVLGCYNALVRSFSEHHPVNFDEEPYHMGASGDIIRRWKKGDGKEFMLGVKYASNGNSINCKCVFAAEEGAEPFFSKAIYSFYSGMRLSGNITCILSDSGLSQQKMFQMGKAAPKNNFIVRTKLPGLHFFVFAGGFPSLLEGEERTEAEDFLKFLKNFSEEFFGKEQASSHDIMDIMRLIGLESVVNMAPVRSKPRRTYDPTNAEATPEGDDIPIHLMRLKHAKDAKWKSLQKALVDFGKSSGMFKGIDVKTFGQAMGDPFQIKVKTGVGDANIMDVGYGVSQLLPILVRMIAQKERPSGTRFLLQQPEVHLHPKAQAELASLLVEFAMNGKGQNYLIETHSDYIVNRIAVEIRRKRISPDNVSLVYHESKNRSVQIHNIEFDEQGNLTNAPKGYRKFFMKETNKFLGLEE